MARPREFDTDTALTGAMDVFWQLGYENASLPDLLSGMGITRGSLYKAFTDKKTLFLTVLTQYDDAAVKPAVAMLCDPKVPNGLDRIDALFGLVLSRVRAGDRRGCLLCTAAAGPAMDDADISKAVGALLADMRHGFDQALKDGGVQREGQADLLLTQYVGLRIITRSQAPLSLLERSFSALKDVLRASQIT